MKRGAIRRKAPAPAIRPEGRNKLFSQLSLMPDYRLVLLNRGPRGRIAPKVVHEQIELELPLATRTSHRANLKVYIRSDIMDS